MLSLRLRLRLRRKAQLLACLDLEQFHVRCVSSLKYEEYRLQEQPT